MYKIYETKKKKYYAREAVYPTLESVRRQLVAHYSPKVEDGDIPALESMSLSDLLEYGELEVHDIFNNRLKRIPVKTA